MAPWRRANLCAAWIPLEILMTLFTVKKQKARHSLAPRRNPKAGLCQTSCFTCLQNPWSGQSIPQCTDSASNVSCVTGLSSRADCWFPTHPLAMVCVRHKDFKLRDRNKCVELDAWMNPILSRTTTNALFCATFSPQSGDKLLF